MKSIIALAVAGSASAFAPQSGSRVCVVDKSFFGNADGKFESLRWWRCPDQALVGDSSSENKYDTLDRRALGRNGESLYPGKLWRNCSRKSKMEAHLVPKFRFLTVALPKRSEVAQGSNTRSSCQLRMSLEIINEILCSTFPSLILILFFNSTFLSLHS